MRNDKFDSFPFSDSHIKDPPNNAAKPIESTNSSAGEPADMKPP